MDVSIFRTKHLGFLARDGATKAGGQGGVCAHDGGLVGFGAGLPEPGNNLSRSMGASSEAYAKHSEISSSLSPGSEEEPLAAMGPLRKASSTAPRSSRRMRSRLRETLDSCSPKVRPTSARVCSSA